ncbi:serine/threonine-protein kinase KIN2 [Tulasnella sp. JGI-2019a]|nr:serine/threonine-protein kinase KIN2 [Tulasnella sp. JGI-2019a]KAG9027045.1 serine/threonine-protein kinase KIN2 [Tulasnella sp. JGI-2019a]
MDPNCDSEVVSLSETVVGDYSGEKVYDRFCSSALKPKSPTLGEYRFGKTIGVGSFGKVKVAHHNITGEKVNQTLSETFSLCRAIDKWNMPLRSQFAIKIIPRPIPAKDVELVDCATANTALPSSRRAPKSNRSPEARERRIIREASFGMLLYHPHICEMWEMIVDQDNYYLVFDYIDGGSMLDYIINHGRLREKVARKFARQIGSALGYCHQNGVVHRNIRIEDIMITQEDNIKIIDFGLANFWKQGSHMATLCGSLYFPAPELLRGVKYHGPAVDVWSFGVVLYVMVCGRVPFDDGNMPRLHTKIKLGHIDYPKWLSSGAKDVLSRMLATNPTMRVTVADFLAHPWTVRGFPGPPTLYTIDREPIPPIISDSSPLEREVIRGIAGFEFGSEVEIEAKLVEILKSADYRQAVENRAKSGQRRTAVPGVESSVQTDLHLTCSATAQTLSVYSLILQAKIRFSGLNSLFRKLLTDSFAPAKDSMEAPDKSGIMSSPLPQTKSSVVSLMGVKAKSDGIEMDDRTIAFHPLISVYFLVWDKLERERVDKPLRCGW